jgi:hypothetical protein
MLIMMCGSYQIHIVIDNKFDCACQSKSNIHVGCHMTAHAQILDTFHQYEIGTQVIRVKKTNAITLFVSEAVEERYK